MEWSKLLFWLNKTTALDKRKDKLSEEDRKLLEEFENIWDVVGTYKSDYRPDTEAGLNRFKKRIAKENKSFVRITRRQVFSLAATFALFVTSFIAYRYFYFEKSIEISHITQFDEIREVELPDGSAITLNQSSSLHFHWEKGQTRKVELSGEAYFVVESNKDEPFIITTPNSRVIVTGTSFNVRDYAEELFAEVEVASGSVRCTTGKDEVSLEARERVVIESSGELTKDEAPNLNANFWKTRKLSFRDTPLDKVLEDIERHYHVHFKTMDLRGSQCAVTYSYEDAELENILATLELIYSGINVKKLSENSYSLTGICN